MAANRTPEEIASSFAKVLTKHGHGFQWAVAKRLHELAASNRSFWSIQATELPIENKVRESHIDIVLRSWDQGRFYMVVECKRVLPTRGAWVFARASHKQAAVTKTAFDGIHVDQNGRVLRGTKYDILGTSPNFDHAVSLSTDGRCEGDEKEIKPLGNPTTELEDATTQALRGATGLINHMTRTCRPEDLDEFKRSPPIVIPVVVTTAELWGCAANIADADLATARIDVAKLQPKPMQVIWYSFNRSRSLMSDQLKSSYDGRTLTHWIEHESRRTVVLINASAIDEFFARDLATYLSI